MFAGGSFKSPQNFTASEIDMEKRSYLGYLLLVLVPFLYFACFSYFSLSLSPFGFKGAKGIDYENVVVKPILLSIFTVIGIFSKIAYDYTKAADEKNFKISKIFKKTINSKYAWLSMLISPLVILGFYKSIETITSYAFICLSSFQNGFFFNSILTKVDSNEQSS